jgi:hypothetical protein
LWQINAALRAIQIEMNVLDEGKGLGRRGGLATFEALEGRWRCRMQV